MTRNTVSTRYFVLGLIAQQPMTGYDVKLLLDSFRWLVGSLSFGSLYPVLHALLRDGLLSVDVVSEDSRPSRKIYSITEAGQQALCNYLEQPVDSDVSLKAFMMRLILAHNLSPDRLAAYLEQRHAQVAAQSASLRPDAEEHQDSQQLAFEYGIVMANAELAWLESKLEQL